MHNATDNAPVHMICRYCVKPGHEGEFLKVLRTHWKTLHGEGLTTNTPARLWKCADQRGRVAFIEEFSWKSPASAGIAHSTPAVMALWEPMGSYCSEMEFWDAEEITSAKA